MLKNILKLEGAQELTKKEQKSISGSASELVCQRPDILICCPDTGLCGCAPKGTPCMLI
ncbi:hypothetical protein OIU83_20495 [Flavobacterium sp. LS1R49]|uniref:Uncharacterized protein n=1 Tax=Flavobacterium shii TaxID=2987687 RepID=A0A9X2ZHU0_9FLAO|nr:hypothetical protein [Flavobacterium shii]MCV9930052.1 hypothetical protein [Flavobacterium shii]